MRGKMKSVRMLNKELPIIYERGIIDNKDITYIFGKVREILENRKKYKSDYPELNFFCNWCAHSKLSSSNVIYNMLLKLSQSLSAAIDLRPGDDGAELTAAFVKLSSAILSIPKFRLGLQKVLEDQGINSKITRDDELWYNCMCMVLNEVSEKPIGFPDNILDGSCVKGKPYQIFQSIKSLSSEDDVGKIISLSVHFEEKAHIFQGGDGFVFHMKTMTGVNLISVVRG